VSIIKIVSECIARFTPVPTQYLVAAETKDAAAKKIIMLKIKIQVRLNITLSILACPSTAYRINVVCVIVGTACALAFPNIRC
jgi:hypothetical protein